MSNDDLVEIVRKHQYYQEYHSPEFDKVLEAMLRVDRIDFLPEEVPVEVTVDYHESRLMYDARMVLVDDGKTKDDKVKALEAMLRYMDKLYEIRGTPYNPLPPSLLGNSFGDCRILLGGIANKILLSVVYYPYIVVF